MDGGAATRQYQVQFEDLKRSVSACRGADGLGTTRSSKASAKDEEFEQSAARISQLQARCPDNIREHDRPGRDTFRKADCGANKKAEQYDWKQHKYSEPEPERCSDTQHCYSDRFQFEALQHQLGPEDLNSL
jgi:hypothetical protein